MLTIGNIPLKNKVILAPMSGVSDLPFRRIALRYGVGLVVSEMVASEALCTGHPESLMRADGEGINPHIVQLAGKDPHWMGEGARMAEKAGADVIDINMGCPAKKVTSGYSGSALMKDLDHAMTLIEATLEAVSVPVTLKMRLGWDESSINAPELAKRAVDAGVQMITVHGRTRSQFYKGKADWKAIRKVRDVVDVPLVANGDCCSFEDADEMLSQSGADLVMVGRGAYGRPWLPGHIAHYLETGEKRSDLYGEELAELVVGHYDAMLGQYGLEIGVRAFRKHIGWYLDANGSLAQAPQGFMKGLMTSLDREHVRNMLHEWFMKTPMRSAA
ncbi:tRNA-dihydrouridine synthase C [Pseudovibrio axinellae]|uniref:tRNA-dihydrouridine synthase n=1 Tax=Pseudovibrio axinellae TaxID=989403 RepID=A0A165UNY3_9HYPH|nr:tRNA dihydrouridine synthase DusB [Pseudovibrio axinellae]KZL12631.1 tRNA-dihydrouridine synthase C [Pseudovibrio axinellae]SEP63718.1 tRNA-U20-dihydrouridine synthase [Pseudovibrio axinellae]